MWLGEMAEVRKHGDIKCAQGFISVKRHTAGNKNVLVWQAVD